MGSYYVNKLLLLDEKDAEQDYGFGFDDFDELREYMMQFAEEEIGNRSGPEIVTIGCASERFDQSREWSDYHGTCWASTGLTWHQSLERLYSRLGGIDAAAISKFQQFENTQELLDEVKEQIGGCLDEENFATARNLVTSLENLKAAGLPCFRTASDFDASEEEGAYDLRKSNHGPGTRVLVEIALDWG